MLEADVAVATGTFFLVLLGVGAAAVAGAAAGADRWRRKAEEAERARRENVITRDLRLSALSDRLRAMEAESAEAVRFVQRRADDSDADISAFREASSVAAAVSEGAENPDLVSANATLRFYDAGAALVMQLMLRFAYEAVYRKDIIVRLIEIQSGINAESAAEIGKLNDAVTRLDAQVVALQQTGALSDISISSLRLYLDLLSGSLDSLRAMVQPGGCQTQISAFYDRVQQVSNSVDQALDRCSAAAASSSAAPAPAPPASV